MTLDDKLKELFREYPFLLDDLFQLTRSEAEEIYLNGFPDAVEIIAGAKKKYVILPEAWILFDEALLEYTKNQLSHNI